MKSVLIIGLGRFGKHMAGRLTEIGNEVRGDRLRESRVDDAANMYRKRRSETDERTVHASIE